MGIIVSCAFVMLASRYGSCCSLLYERMHKRDVRYCIQKSRIRKNTVQKMSVQDNNLKEEKRRKLKGLRTDTKAESVVTQSFCRPLLNDRSAVYPYKERWPSWKYYVPRRKNNDADKNVETFTVTRVPVGCNDIYDGISKMACYQMVRFSLISLSNKNGVTCQEICDYIVNHHYHEDSTQFRSFLSKMIREFANSGRVKKLRRGTYALSKEKAYSNRVFRYTSINPKSYGNRTKRIFKWESSAFATKTLQRKRRVTPPAFTRVVVPSRNNFEYVSALSTPTLPSEESLFSTQSTCFSKTDGTSSKLKDEGDTSNMLPSTGKLRQGVYTLLGKDHVHPVRCVTIKSNMNFTGDATQDMSTKMSQDVSTTVSSNHSINGEMDQSETSPSFRSLGYFTISKRLRCPPRRESIHQTPPSELAEIEEENTLLFASNRPDPTDVVECVQKDGIDSIVPRNHLQYESNEGNVATKSNENRSIDRYVWAGSKTVGNSRALPLQPRFGASSKRRSTHSLTSSLLGKYEGVPYTYTNATRTLPLKASSFIDISVRSKTYRKKARPYRRSTCPLSESHSPTIKNASSTQFSSLTHRRLSLRRAPRASLKMQSPVSAKGKHPDSSSTVGLKRFFNRNSRGQFAKV